MCNIRKYHNARCTNVSTIVLNFLSILASLITIIYFGVKFSSLSDYEYIYDYEHGICSPVTISLIKLENCDGTYKFQAIWQTKNGLTVENPFASRKTSMEAIADQSKFEVFKNYSCMCRYNIFEKYSESSIIGLDKCQAWSTCIFSSDFVMYVQRDGKRYYWTYIRFIIASVVSLVITVVLLPFSFFNLPNKKREYVDLDEKV